MNIRIKKNKTCYDINLKRSATILRGSSGSGKTNLCVLIDEYTNNPQGPVSIVSDMKVAVLHGVPDDIDSYFKLFCWYVFFIDETNISASSKSDLYKRMIELGCWVVVITRDTEISRSLECAADSILELHKNGNYVTTREYKKYWRCTMREPFEVDESYDVTHAEDIITGRLTECYAERVPDYTAESIYKRLRTAEEYLWRALHTDDVDRAVYNYLSSLKCLMGVRTGAQQPTTFRKYIQLLHEYGYKVDKVFTENADELDKTQQIPSDIFSEFLVAYDRFHNNTNLEAYSFLAEYVRYKNHDYDVYTNNKLLVSTYFDECANERLTEALKRQGINVSDHIVVDTRKHLVRKERIPTLYETSNIDDVYKWCVIVAASGVTKERLAELYSKEVADLWDEILHKATVMAGDRVVKLGDVNPKGFRNRYIAVEEILLMITDWKIRDAGKQVLKLKEIICK